MYTTEREIHSTIFMYDFIFVFNNESNFVV